MEEGEEGAEKKQSTMSKHDEQGKDTNHHGHKDVGDTRQRTGAAAAGKPDASRRQVDGAGNRVAMLGNGGI